MIVAGNRRGRFFADDPPWRRPDPSAACIVRSGRASSHRLAPYFAPNIHSLTHAHMSSLLVVRGRLPTTRRSTRPPPSRPRPSAWPRRWAQTCQGAAVAAQIGSVAQVPMPKQAQVPLVLGSYAPCCVVPACDICAPADPSQRSEPFYRSQTFVRTLKTDPSSPKLGR